MAQLKIRYYQVNVPCLLATEKFVEYVMALNNKLNSNWC